MTMDRRLMSIQTVLKQLSIYRGKADGLSGPLTTQAILNFQTINPPLQCDGIAGPATFAKLFLKVDPLVIQSHDDVVDKFADDAKLTKFYGKPRENLTKAQLPYAMKLAWDTKVEINSFTCHKLIATPLHKIFTEVLASYGQDGVTAAGLDLFGGCFSYRLMRGGTSLSRHSWAIAVDIDPLNNQLKWDSSKARLASADYHDFWDIVESHGGVSLGREKNYDWQHFQFTRI